MSRIRSILKSVSAQYDIPVERIYGTGKKTQKDSVATAARWKVIHELKNGENPLSYPQIGQLLNIDHSTVIYAARKMKETNGTYVDEKLKRVGKQSMRTHQQRNRAVRLEKLRKAFEHGILYNPQAIR